MTNLAAIKVKANAKYTCQKCGSTELIQAHHETPGDDSSLLALCAECHSKKHPDVPRALFFSKRLQPYWHNKSASSLSRELGVHPRTIIRAARRLTIHPGKLSHRSEKLIKNSILKLNRPPKKIADYPDYPIRTCPRCGYNWRGTRITAKESACPRCKNWIAIDNPKSSRIKIEHQVPLLPNFKVKQ